MEQPQQSQNTKIILAIVTIVLILGLGYVLLGKYRAPREANQQASRADEARQFAVVVENTPITNGTVIAPEGFPEEIPIETSGILESATTRYPAQNAKQLSINYNSTKTIAQKYAEYKNYMTKAGYNMTEGDANTPVRALFGTKRNANLSVVVSRIEDKTLVQLSYLLKSAL